MPDAAERRNAWQAAQTTAEVRSLRERLIELERELATLPDLHEAAAERDHLRERAALLERNLLEEADARKAAVAELEHLRVVLADMKSSLSWRVTKPLRRMAAARRRR